MKHLRNPRFLVLIMALALLLAACGGEAPEALITPTEEMAAEEAPTEEAAEHEVSEEGEVIEVTRIVSEAVEVEVTLTREPAAATSIPSPTVLRSPIAQATLAPASSPPASSPPATSPPATMTMPPRATATQSTEGPVTTISPTGVPPAVTEERLAEVEWPVQMRLGDSDFVRLSVVSVEEGFELTTEFPDHRTVTETVTLAQPAGYDLSLAARLDGIGFDITPGGDQMQDWRLEEPLVWRWAVSPERTGRQLLVLSLVMHWQPQAGNESPARQRTVLSKGLDVQVTTLLGMTTRQVVLTGIMGLLLGIVLNVPLIRQWRGVRRDIQRFTPNAGLVVEPHPEIELSPAEDRLLRALFYRYARLTLELEFRSGYSGARTLLARPIHPDGRADAYTIAKVGEEAKIRREYDNYKTFVEHTLPPVTARIQDTPVMVARRSFSLIPDPALSLAAIRYTFIGEPGDKPISLRQALLARPEPVLLEKLFRTFGPNWWMQRRPFTFRWSQEYDRKLPSHFVIEPAQGRGELFDGRTAPGEVRWSPGDLVRLSHFEVVERMEDGSQLSLRGQALPGQPPLRLKWLSPETPDGTSGRVVETRASLLQRWTADFELYSLPDPLEPLPHLLSQQASGTQSIIHGDLNLQNILVGPGEFVWLIDFANTREGHTQVDFAHLGAEIIAHVLTPQITSDQDYLMLLDNGGGPLLVALERIARRCLFDTDRPHEYYMALYLSCLGALKYGNLKDQQKHRLYLTAAFLVSRLGR